MGVWHDRVRPLVQVASWLGIAILVGGVAWVGLNRPVSGVLVEGALTKADRAAVQAALEPNLNIGLLRLDLDSVVAQVNALAWPQSVSVRRVWPNQLVVTVVKQQVVAAWNDRDYLTSTGQIVTLATLPNQTEAPLPQLRAVNTPPAKVLEIYQRLAALTRSQAYDAQNNHRLVALNQDALGAWQVTLAPALAVKLGKAESVGALVARLDRFFLVRQQQPDNAQRQLRYADARYASGVALRWEAQAAPAGTPELAAQTRISTLNLGLQDSNL